MARVLVTGATGFIGRHLVRCLAGRGDSVRCLIHRNEERLAGVDCVRADITVPETLERVVRGVDIVYHLAGATLVTSPHRYRTINGLGTRNLGKACARLSNPPVLVYLSSLAAAGPTRPGQPRCEEQPPIPISEYGRSKLMGERCLRGLADRLPVTVLRPPGVFGPGDPNLLMLFKSARRGVNFIPGSLDQQLALIYVEDLVEALLAAAERGERLPSLGAGQDCSQGIYFVAMEEYRTLAELGLLAASALGERRCVSPQVSGVNPIIAPVSRPNSMSAVSPPIASVRTIVVPPWIGQVMARATDFLARLTMQPMLLTSDKMREALAGSWTCSSEKAKRAWGFTCRTGIVDGFQKTVAWYRAAGWL